MAMTARIIRCGLARATPSRAGSRRRTSTKATRVTSSTRTWVSARSGAPCSANIADMPNPVTPTSTTAWNRFPARVDATAATIITSAIASWAG